MVRYGMFLVRRMVRRISFESADKLRKFLYDCINVTIRRGMGKDIDAACGQLRKTYMENL